MKKLISLALCVMMLFASSISLVASEYETVDMSIDTKGSSQNTSGAALTTSGSALSLRAEIMPSVMTVTMPTSINFDISKNIQGENKAIAPIIKFKNNSNLEVTISVVRTDVYIAGLEGATWSDNGVFDITTENKVAVGLRTKTSPDLPRPTSFDGAYWLKHGVNSYNLLSLAPGEMGYCDIVGKIGINVIENRAFTAVPILVAKAN